MDPIELIPKGHKNTVSREYLSKVTGLSDRKIRKAIENATRSGTIIINLDNGYFRYSGEEDFPYMESYYRREMARGWSIINKCRVIRGFINRNESKKSSNQISIFDYMRDRNV